MSDNIWDDPDETMLERISIISKNLNIEESIVFAIFKESYRLYIEYIKESLGNDYCDDL